MARRDSSLGWDPSDAWPDGPDREEDQALPERPDRRGLVVDRGVAAATAKRGRKRTTDLREVVNAIRYMVRSGPRPCRTRRSRPSGSLRSFMAARNTSAGVVTLSQTERNLATIANVDARDFSDLACWLIVQIGPISLNVTTPVGEPKLGSLESVVPSFRRLTPG